MKHPPTQRLLDLEAAIIRLTAANNGISPTAKELAAELGISGAAISHLIKRGIARGRLTHIPHLQRTLQVVRDREEAAA